MDKYFNLLYFIRGFHHFSYSFVVITCFVRYPNGTCEEYFSSLDTEEFNQSLFLMEQNDMVADIFSGIVKNLIISFETIKDDKLTKLFNNKFPYYFINLKKEKENGNFNFSITDIDTNFNNALLLLINNIKIIASIDREEKSGRKEPIYLIYSLDNPFANIKNKNIALSDYQIAVYTYLINFKSYVQRFSNLNLRLNNLINEKNNYLINIVTIFHNIILLVLIGRNVTLINPRRMGKSGLIRHCFHQMEAEKQAKCYYVDLYKTDSLSSLIEQLAITVLGSLDTTEKNIIKQVTTFFKSLRTLLSFDSLTGVPTFMADVKPELAEHSLAEIFSYLEQSGHLCIIAMDEFQMIADYRENNMKALLRSHIQHLSSVHFIFSGSQRHMLENMFASANRPFYQSSQILNLYEIQEQSYY